MDSAAGPRATNFDALRLLAAVAVLVSHSFTIAFGTDDGHEPFLILSRNQATLGGVAVLVFFVISGYLITQSFDRSPDPRRFLRARALRIIPGLFVSLLLTVAVLGPAVTALPLARYLSAPETLTYLPANLLLFLPQFDLPGVFATNPVPNAVNGSLWTLQYEFAMYLVVLALGLCNALTRYVVLALWAVVMVLTWRWIGGFAVAFAASFLSGAVLYLWRDRLACDWRLAALSMAMVVLATLTHGFHIAFATFGAYLVIYLATAPAVRLPDLARYGDLSYGVYIYAFVTQQTVAQLLGPAVTWYWDVALSLPLSLALAWLSWHYVERPALALKRARAPAACDLRPKRS